MLRQAVLIFLFIVTTAASVFAAEPTTTGLFLTFEQRLALSYALLAQGEPEAEKEKILARAKSYFKGMMKKPVDTVVVKNFQEFLTTMRGEWPNTHSLALDIEILEKAGPRSLKLYTSPSERIQGQIERYMAWQNGEMMKMAASQQDTMDVASEHFGKKLKQMMDSSSLPLVQKVAETWLLEKSEAVLADRMKELDRVGEKVAESSFAQQQDPTMRIFMQTLLGEYFSRLSMDSKKLIVSSFIGGNLLADDMKKFEVMVQNSGTILQKLLQVVARQSNLPPAVVEVFRGLESSVRPVPWVLVEEILKKESKNYEFTYFERKPLGVGTMAQVHRAKILVNGQREDVVARFIKPGADIRTEEDRRIINEVAPLIDGNPEFIRMQVPKLTPIAEDIVKTVVAEFDQEATKARQRKARVYEQTLPFRSKTYQSDIQFHVPAIFEAKGNKASAFMVQEMVIGGKLDKQAAIFESAVPELKRVLVEGMAKVWAKEALFGSGFYHSDLHQGNFMVNVVEPKIVVNILDFGMGGTISPELQRQVMVLGVGTDIISGDLIGRSFWDLSDKERNAISEADFKKAVNAKAENIRKGREPNISMELWMAWALNKGLGVPYEFVSLNRGMGIVNKLLEESGSKLDLTKITKSLAKEHPMVVYNALVVREKVPLKDLVRVGWSEMKTVFQDEPAKIRSFSLPNGGAVSCQAVFH